MLETAKNWKASNSHMLQLLTSRLVEPPNEPSTMLYSDSNSEDSRPKIALVVAAISVCLHGAA